MPNHPNRSKRWRVYVHNSFPSAFVITDGDRVPWVVPASREGWRQRTPYGADVGALREAHDMLTDNQRAAASRTTLRMVGAPING